MDKEKLYEQLSIKTNSKLVMLVMDGIGGIPVNGKTELEAAEKPNLNNLAKISSTGLIDPLATGITPGSGPAHLALFGYNPFKYNIGRGVLEALGIGFDLTVNDLAVRGNFATKDENGLVIDRRAGRPTTEYNRTICTKLQEEITKIEDIEILIKSGMEHRFVIIFRGEGLYGPLSETDPQNTGLKPLSVFPGNENANKAARIINTFIDKANIVLKDFNPVNTCLLRGLAKSPDIPTMTDLFKLKCAAIATYPMYRGLAKLVGMEILNAGTTLEDEVETLKSNWNDFDFFFFHVKKTDSYGEDGNFENKVKVVENVDRLIPAILNLKPDVLAITGDHSTPSALKGHSWHPNPFLLHSSYIRQDKVQIFDETECVQGNLGRFPAEEIMPLMMANGLKFAKYGA